MRRLLPHFSLIALYLLSFTLFAVISLNAPGFFDVDCYYHTEMARQIAQQGTLRINFPWLPFTILNAEQFVDHHLLFHLYLVPFVFVGGANGAKVASASIIAVIFVAIWALLRQIGVRYALGWTLALLGISVPFFLRLMMIRTQGAALLCLVIAINLLVTRRYRLLIPLGFALVWLYNGFIILLAAAGAYFIAVWLTERRILWRVLLYPMVGIALGLVINPYFPQNITFIASHLGAKVTIAEAVRVGNEWYPYNTETLLNFSSGALIAFLLGVIRPSLGEHRRDVAETFLLLMVLITGFMLFRSRRFIEYFPAMALLFGAAAWGRSSPDLAQFIPLLPHKAAQRLMRAAIIISVIVFCGVMLGHIVEDAQAVTPFEAYAEAGVWLRDNTPQGTMIFQTDWDDFTRLFYHNPNGVYLVGLDPTYLSDADPQLWQEWVAITRGEVETPSTAIRERFESHYVFSDTRHRAFIRRAEADRGLGLVYRDAYAYIWQVLPALP